MKTNPLKLVEIADRIRVHLKRMEAAQPEGINLPLFHRRPVRYFQPNAWPAVSRVGVRYVSYQVTSFLTKAEALAYLAWLDAGNEGRHRRMKDVAS